MFARYTERGTLPSLMAKETPMKAETKQWLITGGIVAVLVLLVWWGVAHRQPASPVVGNDETSATTTTEVTDGTIAASASDPVVRPVTPTEVASGETVTVQDQSAGATVAVSQVTLKSPSWVAIKDTTGRILGAGWFYQSGENLSVPLLRSTIAGEAYQAVIYVDNGDKQFDFHKDTLITSVDGAPVSSTFRAN